MTSLIPNFDLVSAIRANEFDGIWTARVYLSGQWLVASGSTGADAVTRLIQRLERRIE